MFNKLLQMENFILFMKNVAKELQESGSYGTAHVYRSSINAIMLFHGTDRLEFRQITPGWLKQFEISLRNRGCSWNTVSTYIRTLRAVYNRAVDARKAIYVPNLFRSVYTGTRADCKRALHESSIAKVFGKPKNNKVTPMIQRTQDLFIFMFLLRGLPFVDLAYLKKSDLYGNTIRYRRRKTGRILTVTLTPEALSLLSKYKNEDKNSLYLFPLLRSEEGSEKAYREYQLALRNFNYQLHLLGRLLDLKENLSTYTARHTWATTAYHCEIHPGIISEAMGHSSLTVTETYLKPFQDKKIDEANNRIISFMMQTIKTPNI